ncbi:hypothetical protein B0813_001377 [Candidatus Fervidibacteria bacterium JGI MDM2 SSWTFF-3-K9]
MVKFAPTLIEVVKLLLLPSTLFTFAFLCLDCASPSKTVKFPDEPPRYPMYDVAGTLRRGGSWSTMPARNGTRRGCIFMSER